MVLVERIRSHGEVHGRKETSIEAELRKEIEGCKVSKRMKRNKLSKTKFSLMFFVFFGSL